MSNAKIWNARARDGGRIDSGELRQQRGPPTGPSNPPAGGGGGDPDNVTITITGQGGRLAFSPTRRRAQGQMVVFKNNDTSRIT